MKYPTRIYCTEADKSLLWDRWQDGAVDDFTLSEISPGTWRFEGTIIHGDDPYLPCDRIGEIRLNYPSELSGWIIDRRKPSHKISAIPGNVPRN
jgi:hypothetical protein